MSARRLFSIKNNLFRDAYLSITCENHTVQGLDRDTFVVVYYALTCLKSPASEKTLKSLKLNFIIKLLLLVAKQVSTGQGEYAFQ